MSLPQERCAVCERWVAHAAVRWVCGAYLTDQPRYALCGRCHQLYTVLALWAGGVRASTVIEATQAAWQAWDRMGSPLAQTTTEAL